MKNSMIFSVKVDYFYHKIINHLMGLQDLIVTPIHLVIILFFLFIFRTKVTTDVDRKYFIPLFLVKVIGAVSLGLVYQYYYDGGDTYNYWEHGSYWIWKAFVEDPLAGLDMLVGNIKDPEYFEYYSRIWLRRSDSAMFLVRLTAFFDLFTYHTYSATSLYFALFSFSGQWAMYRSLSNGYSGSWRYLLIGIFLVPSVVFWCSGILKDTVVIGSLGWIIWSLTQIIRKRNATAINLLVLFLSTLFIFKLKLYVLLSLIPSVFVWVYFHNLSKIKHVVIRYLWAPFFLIVLGGVAFIGTKAIGEESNRYRLESIPEWSKITAYDLRYWTGRNAGSGYELGELDGTWSNLLSKFPQAVNVAIFRPYLWEVNNVFMLLSSVESTIFLILIILSFFKGYMVKISRDPTLIFLLAFILVFSFAVGVSTFNFGTLVRYKTPMLPFLGAIIAIIFAKSRNRLPV